MNGITIQSKWAQPGKSKSETKAEITDRTARAIIDAEAARRDAKTEKLRQARMENHVRKAGVPVSGEERPVRISGSRYTKFPSANRTGNKDTTT